MRQGLAVNNKKSENKILQEQGSILVHVLIMITLSAIGLATLYFTGVGQFWSKSVQGIFESRALHSEILGLLSDVRHCTRTFAGNDTSVANSLSQLTGASNDVYSTNGSQRDFLTMGILSLTANPAIVGSRSFPPSFPLNVFYRRVGQVFGSSQLGRQINLSFDNSGVANIVASCLAESAASTAASGFQMMVEDGQWTFRPGNAADLPMAIIWQPNAPYVVVNAPARALKAPPPALAAQLTVNGSVLSRGPVHTTGTTVVVGTTYIAGINAILDSGYYVSLTVGGTLAAKYHTASDRSYKEDIHYLTHLVQPVRSLRGVSYTLKSNPQAAPGFGFIAQEVEELLPEIVSTDPETGLRIINYDSFVPVAIGALQNIQEEVDDLQRRVATQNSELEQLLKRFCEEFPNDSLCSEKGSENDSS